MRCKVKGCPREKETRGYCDMHYRRWLKTGRPGLAIPLKKRPTKDEEEMIVRIYKELQSTKKVGEKSGFSAETVRRVVGAEPGLLLPPGSGTAKDLDESFFESWSPEMAWCLGLLWTDGCLTERHSIELTSTDRDVLEKFKKSVSGEQKISKCYDRRRGYSWFRYRFGSLVVANRLRELGLTERKSLVVDFPRIPHKYLRHFLRGVFDGDGSVMWQPRDKAVRLSFATGSDKMKRDLVRVFKERGYRISSKYEPKYVERSAVRAKKVGRPRTAGHCWNIKLNRIDDIRDFFNWIYRDVPRRMRMDRKYEDFRTYLKKYDFIRK